MPSNPVDGLKNPFLPDDILFQTKFSWKVSEHQPDEDGDQSLPWKQEHGYASQNKGDACAIFCHCQQEIQFGMG